VKNDVAAAAVCKALAGAVMLESKYISHQKREVFWPNQDRQTQVGIQTVSWEQILRSEPTDDDVSSPAAMKSLGVKPSLKLLGL
jgi:hypothetical protein